jgi:hypothetical protein
VFGPFHIFMNSIASSRLQASKSNRRSCRIAEMTASTQEPTTNCQSPSGRHPCYSTVNRTRRGLRARSGERALRLIRILLGATFASRLMVPATRAGPDIHLLPQAREPSQMIECVFSASPETIRREPRELNSVAQSATCRTWQPAHRSIPMFLLFPY